MEKRWLRVCRSLRSRIPRPEVFCDWMILSDWKSDGHTETTPETGKLGRRCRCRPVRCLNNVVGQDHRAIKRRVRASQGFRSFDAAWRTIQGIEAMNMIRKGQVRWIPKDNIVGQVAFIASFFGVAVAV